MKQFNFPNLFEVNVPDWAIPSFWVGMTAAFLLALGYPIGALIAAIVCGAVIWFGHSRTGTWIFFILFSALLVSVGLHLLR